MDRIRWYLSSAILVLLVWQALSAVINNSQLLPDIGYVFANSLPSIAVFSGQGKPDYLEAIKVITVHSGFTFLRLICGLFCGTLIGVGAGLGIHFFRRSHTANVLVLTVVRSVPLFALIPLFLFWFGGKEMGIYLYITFAVSVIIATNTYEAVCNVPGDFANQARLLGATRPQIFRTVYLQAIGPEMLGSLRNVL